MSAVMPLVHDYRQVLDHLRRKGSKVPALKRVSELVSLLELTTTLGSNSAGGELLGAALRIVMAETQATHGAFFVRGDDGTLTLRASSGLPAHSPSTLSLNPASDEVMVREPEGQDRDGHGFALLCPVHRGERTIAVLGLGPPAAGGAYGPEDLAYVRGVAACAAAPIENGLLHDDLRRVNRELSIKAFGLHNLFDISRDLTGRSDEEAIQDLITTTAMGHFLVARCALYLLGPRGLALAYERGMRRPEDSPPIPTDEARAALQHLPGPTAVGELRDGPLRRRLEEARLALAVPLSAGDQVQGVLAIGERASRTPFSAEDREFAQTLARHAAAALEGARLRAIRMQKLRQDRELQLAREIQRGLLPARSPMVPGFEVAADSRSCYEVGGDSYDWIPLENGRLALVIGDVAGKGTPASLLMASVQASVHTLAGTAGPARVMERLNHFLFVRSQVNRYVTLFYGELDTEARQLAYVNAGHVPPYHVASDGTCRRLSTGGMALGLLDGAAYEVGQARLEPGDVVAMVTDGVTDANSLDGTDFGEERLGAALRGLSGGSASAILEGLVGAVDAWVGGAPSTDDLTALVLKAR
jgi:sigma-B regulation protein RsbU (phosphoserine phosphatase)